jgi:hypothetical protein
MEDSGPPPPPTIPSLPARLVQVFFSPGQLFEALKEKPAWAGPIIVSALFVGLSTLLIPADIMVEATRQQILSQGGQVPPNLEAMANLFRFSGAVGALLFLFVWAFVLAGISAFVFNFIFGGEGRYKQYLSIIGHGMVIGALGALLVTPLKIAEGDPQLLLSLGTFAFFLEEGYLLNVLKMLDLFGLWGATVMGIGVTKVVPRVGLGPALGLYYGLTVAMALIIGAFV